MNVGDLRLLEVDHHLICLTNTQYALSLLLLMSYKLCCTLFRYQGRCCAWSFESGLSFYKREGIFYGQCSELCGINHAFMPIVLEAITKGF